MMLEHVLKSSVGLLCDEPRVVCVLAEVVKDRHRREVAHLPVGLKALAEIGLFAVEEVAFVHEPGLLYGLALVRP